MKLQNLIITVLFSLGLVSTGNFTYGQSSNLEKTMKQEFDNYTNGKKFQDWFQSAETLDEVGKKFPNEWLPEFWASYFYTQISSIVPKENPPKDISSQIILDKSQRNFDSAYNKVKNMTPQLESDFLVLQSLIYDFRNWLSNDETIKKEFQSKRENTVKKAIGLSQDSPVLEVYIATDLIKLKDLKSIYAGRNLLYEAQRKFNQRQKPRYMSTHFIEQWVEFWIGHSEKLIKEALDDNSSKGS
jgi:hypothetical protein